MKELSKYIKDYKKERISGSLFRGIKIGSGNTRVAITHATLLFTPFTVTRFTMHRNHALHDFAPQLSGFL